MVVAGGESTGAGAGSGPFLDTSRKATTAAAASPPPTPNTRPFLPRAGTSNDSSISDDADDSVVEAFGDIVCAIVFEARREPGTTVAGRGAVTLISPTRALRNSSMLAKRASGSLASDFMIAAAMCGGVLGAKSVTSGGSSSMCFANSSPTPSATNGGRPATISNEHHAERIDVGAVIEHAGALALLGRHVERRPHQRTGAGLDRLRPVGGREDLGHAEVEDLHQQRSVRLDAELDVVRLEIAVDDPLGVRREQRAAHLHADGLHLGGRHRPTGDRLGQRLARQVLHDEVRLAVRGLAEVEDLDDVLVRDHVDRAGLVEEAGDDVRIARQDRVQQLDRHLAADHRVLGQVHHAHAPLAEQADDPIISDVSG